MDKNKSKPPVIQTLPHLTESALKTNSTEEAAQFLVEKSAANFLGKKTSSLKGGDAKDLAHLLVQTAISQHADGTIDTAIKNFKAALKLDPNNQSGNLFYGVYLVENKRFQEAIPYLEKSKSLNSNCLLTLLKLGEAYFGINDFKKSLENYKLAQTFKAPDKEAASYLNSCIDKTLHELQRSKESLKLLQKDIDLNTHVKDVSAGFAILSLNSEVENLPEGDMNHEDSSREPAGQTLLEQSEKI